MVVPPVLVLLPVRVSVPVPALLIPKLLYPSLKVPLEVALVLLPPAVKVAALPPLLFTLPLPAKEATLLENH